MVVAVELRGVHKRAIWTGPRDQLEGMHAVACEELLAFCLMGTHVHLVLEVTDEEHARAVIRRIRNRLDRSAEARDVARLDEPHVQVLADDHAVLRYIAYAHANPVAAEMVLDPLAWPFSSHRDAYGLRRARWFSPDRLRARVDRWLHSKAGGKFPVPGLVQPIKRKHPLEGLPLLARTVAMVFGVTDEELCCRPDARRCLIVAARFEGWCPPVVADFLGCTARHVQRTALVDTPEVRAVVAAFTDPRLRPTGSAWWEVPAEARGPRLWAAWRETHAAR